MAFLLWKDQYSVQVGLFDEQHKELFRLINDLTASMNTQEAEKGLSRTMSGLLDYARDHFAAEGPVGGVKRGREQGFGHSGSVLRGGRTGSVD